MASFLFNIFVDRVNKKRDHFKKVSINDLNNWSLYYLFKCSI